MTGEMGDVSRALLDGARLEAGDDVLVLGDGELVFGAQERVGGGWVYVVRSHVDELEELLGEAHASGASGVAYLVGETPVLPLPDDAVAAALGRIATDHGALTAAAEELARVLSAGGRVALAERESARGDEIVAALGAAGFGDAARTDAGGEVVVTARLR